MDRSCHFNSLDNRDPKLATLNLFQSERGLIRARRVNSPFCPKPFSDTPQLDRPTFNVVAFLFKYGLMTPEHWSDLKSKLKNNEIVGEEGFITYLFKIFDVFNARDRAEEKDLKRLKKLIHQWIEAHGHKTSHHDSTRGAYSHFQIVNRPKLYRLYNNFTDPTGVHRTGRLNPYDQAFQALKKFEEKHDPKSTYLRDAHIAQLLEGETRRQARRDERRRQKKWIERAAIAEAVIAAAFEAVLTGISTYGVLLLVLGISTAGIGLVIVSALVGLASLFGLATLISNYILFLDTAKGVNRQLFTKDDSGVRNFYVGNDGVEIKHKIPKAVVAGLLALGFTSGLTFLALGGVVGFLTEIGIVTLPLWGVILASTFGALVGAVYVTTFFYVFSDIMRQNLLRKAWDKFGRDINYEEQNKIYRQQQRDKNIEEADLKDLSSIRHLIRCMFRIVAIPAATIISLMVSITFVGTMNGSAVEVLTKLYGSSQELAQLIADISVDCLGIWGAFTYCANKAGVIVDQLICIIPELPRLIYQRLPSLPSWSELRSWPGKFLRQLTKLILLPVICLPYFLHQVVKNSYDLWKGDNTMIMMTDEHIDRISRGLRAQDSQGFRFTCLTVILNAMAQAFILLKSSTTQAYAKGEYTVGEWLSWLKWDFSTFDIKIRELKTCCGAIIAAIFFAIASWKFNQESVEAVLPLAPKASVAGDDEGVNDDHSRARRGDVPVVGDPASQRRLRADFFDDLSKDEDSDEERSLLGDGMRRRKPASGNQVSENHDVVSAISLNNIAKEPTQELQVVDVPAKRVTLNTVGLFRQRTGAPPACKLQEGPFVVEVVPVEEYTKLPSTSTMQTQDALNRHGQFSVRSSPVVAETIQTPFAPAITAAAA